MTCVALTIPSVTGCTKLDRSWTCSRQTVPQFSVQAEICVFKSGAVQGQSCLQTVHPNKKSQVRTEVILIYCAPVVEFSFQTSLHTKGKMCDERGYPRFSFSEKVMVTLMSRYLDKGHRLFWITTTYHWYRHSICSITVQRLLALCNQYDTTFWLNWLMPVLQRARRSSRQGTPVYLQQYSMLKDKSIKKPKVVHMLSTDHGNRCVQTGKHDNDNFNE